MFYQTIIRIEMDKITSLRLQEEENCSSIWEQRELCFTEGIMQGWFRLMLKRWLFYAFISSCPDILSSTIYLLGTTNSRSDDKPLDQLLSILISKPFFVAIGLRCLAHSMLNDVIRLVIYFCVVGDVLC
jgi:hypothetical protein